MNAQQILDISIDIALVLLSLAFLLTVIRIVKGPTLPDRILGLDMLVGAAIGYIAVIGVRTGYTLYVDIAIALGLVGFLATVAFARFILVRGQADQGGREDNHELDPDAKIDQKIGELSRVESAIDSSEKQGS